MQSTQLRKVQKTFDKIRTCSLIERHQQIEENAAELSS